MKKYTAAELLRLLALPGLTVFVGLVLLLSPNTASALVGRLLGWCAILSAAALGTGAFLGNPGNRTSRLLWAAVCLFAGIWLLRNPLSPVEFLGRVLGITLMIRGGKTTVDAIRYRDRELVLSRELILGAALAILGAVLTVLPMAGSRIFFKALGVILICLGLGQAVGSLRGRKQLDRGNDPDIIDVEKV